MGSDTFSLANVASIAARSYLQKCQLSRRGGSQGSDVLPIITGPVEGNLFICIKRPDRRQREGTHKTLSMKGAEEVPRGESVARRNIVDSTRQRRALLLVATKRLADHRRQRKIGHRFQAHPHGLRSGGEHRANAVHYVSENLSDVIVLFRKAEITFYPTGLSRKSAEWGDWIIVRRPRERGTYHPALGVD